MSALGFTDSRKICELLENVNLKKIHKTCEPNLCEPGKHNFSVKFGLRFTFFQSSHISGEPVKLGSHITQAPKCHQNFFHF